MTFVGTGSNVYKEAPLVRCEYRVPRAHPAPSLSHRLPVRNASVPPFVCFKPLSLFSLFLLLTLTLSILGLRFPLGRHCNTRVPFTLQYHPSQITYHTHLDGLCLRKAILSPLGPASYGQDSSPSSPDQKLRASTTIRYDLLLQRMPRKTSTKTAQQLRMEREFA